MGKESNRSAIGDRSFGSNTQRSRKTSENFRAGQDLTKLTPKSSTTGNSSQPVKTPSSEIPRSSVRTRTAGAQKYTGPRYLVDTRRRRINNNNIVGYMDDIKISGPVASVASDINVITDDGSAKGMHLNVAK